MTRGSPMCCRLIRTCRATHRDEARDAGEVRGRDQVGTYIGDQRQFARFRELDEVIGLRLRRRPVPSPDRGRPCPLNGLTPRIIVSLSPSPLTVAPGR